jgi:CHAT domain-containing protein/tetratricopeptide (TPR) repeat protein
MFNSLKVFLLFLFLVSSETAYTQYANIDSDSLLILGNKVYRSGEYVESERIYRQAIAEHSNNVNSKEWIVAAVGLGASLVDQYKTKEGASWVLKADSVARNFPDLELRAYVRSNKGWITTWIGSRTNAISVYKEALAIALESQDDYRIAQISNSLSLFTRISGNYIEAIEYGRAAEKHIKGNEDLFMLSLIKSNLFFIYNELGFAEKAEQLAFESLEVKRKLGNMDLLSRDYDRLGRFYMRLGEYDKSLYYANKHLEASKKTFDPQEIRHANRNVGEVYSLLGDYDAALKFLGRSQELWVEIGNLYQAAIIGLESASIYQKTGNYNKAKNLYLEMLDITVGSEEYTLLSKIYKNLSELELTLKDPQKAFFYANKLIEVSSNTQSTQLKAESFELLSRIHASTGDTALALNYAKKAYSAVSLFKGYRISDYLINLSRRFYDSGSDSSFYFAEIAFTEIEREQNNIYGENLESALFNNYAAFYDQVALWYLESEDNVEKAFEVTERGRSRVLLKRLSVSEDKLASILDEPTLLSVRQQEKNIDKLYRSIENANNDQESTRLKEELSNAEFEYQSFTNELRIKHPELKEFSPLSLISISDFQDKLTKRSALIEYMIVDNKLVTFIVSKNESSYEVFEFDSSFTKANFLNHSVSAFREAIQDQKSIEELESLSSPFIDLLIQPVSSKYPSIDELVIIPTQSLSILPFEALYAHGEYLIQKYNIKYLPSASSYDFIKNPHRETSNDILAVAGSGFNTGSSSNSLRAQNNFASLPSTLLEVDAISRIFDNHTSLKNEEVTEAAIKALPLSAFRYLHFATHANANEVNPQQSGLIISEMNNFESTYGEDGYLNSLEISNLSLNADLVVLSACNTAFGKVIRGEGLLGLQRSFFQAGASSVIVSLWNVYDKSTSILMEDFYFKLNAYKENELGLWSKINIYFNTYEPPLFGYKEKALRDAKLKMIEHPYYNSPVNWAPFIIIGK